MADEDKEREDVKFIILICVAMALLLCVAWQLTPLISEERGMKEIFPAPMPTPDALMCTTEWNKIDRSFLGQRVCVRGSLHAVGSFDSFFGMGSHTLTFSGPSAV